MKNFTVKLFEIKRYNPGVYVDPRDQPPRQCWAVFYLGEIPQFKIKVGKDNYTWWDRVDYPTTPSGALSLSPGETPEVIKLYQMQAYTSSRGGYFKWQGVLYILSEYLEVKAPSLSFFETLERTRDSYSTLVAI